MDTTLTPIAPRTDERDRLIGRLAWVGAWSALVIGQLHALSRHATEEGSKDLDEQPLTRLWAEPAAEFFSPLLTWASPDTVYLSYGKLWLPVLVAATACAFVVRRRRKAVGYGRAEAWAWRIALTGYVGACVGIFAEYWTQWGAMNEALLEGVFFVLIPVVLVAMLGSTFLGVVLIRRGLGLAAWLLALSIPGLFVITTVTSLGNVWLPAAFAFGVLGRRIARAHRGDGVHR